MKGKKKKELNSIVLLFCIIVGAFILCQIVPAGAYERTEINGRMAVVADSFHLTESQKLNFFDVFLAIPSGMANATQMIVGMFLIGGAMACIQESGAINIGISRVIKKMGYQRGNWILVFLFYMFALLGGFLGFIEGSFPFIPLAISIAIGLGYDPIVGVGVALIGAISGFSCGPMNPFTVGVSQTLAGLPMYSGIWLRIVVFAIMPLICLLYILRYAKRIKENPEKSLVHGVDVSDIAFKTSEFETLPFTARHAVILLSLVVGIGFYLYGSLNWGWSFAQLGAVFIILAILAGIISGANVNDIADTFVKGASGMTGAAIMMGAAYGVAYLLQNASVLDTIVYYLSKPISGLPTFASAIGILVVIALINMLIPSASGKALIVMPIILPIAQVVGIESQVAILAYQLGDGITNLCTPIGGLMLFALSFGHVPFAKWEKFILPLIIVMLVIAAVTISFAIAIGYC